MATNTEWTSIRVRTSTLERMREFSRRLLKSAQSGRVDADVHVHGYMGHDVALNVLLDREESHRRRSENSRKKA